MFEYYKPSDLPYERGAFVLTVPAGIRSKQELLASVAGAGRFPLHFGTNWDALLDSLCDFSWIETQAVMILHTDLPLRDDELSYRTYLDILREAQARWQEASSRSSGLSRKQTSDRRLRILFPRSLRQEIDGLLDD